MKCLGIIVLLAVAIAFSGCAGRALNEAKRVNTVSAYDTFLKEYPDHELVKEALDLREKAVFDESKALDSIESYRNYLKQYPSGIYVSDAEDRL